MIIHFDHIKFEEAIIVILSASVFHDHNIPLIVKFHFLSVKINNCVHIWILIELHLSSKLLANKCKKLLSP